MKRPFYPRRNIQRRLASRDLEVLSFDVAVDEVTAGQDHHGVAIVALILPDSLRMAGRGRTGPIRGGLLVPLNLKRSVLIPKPGGTQALRPGARRQQDGPDFSL